ncbi:MAG: hypothetical protein JXR76_12585 [Deltaproteobacteria bacterium]|nr:hypothetical protein [Deltaproteobacteria bacterium]
MAQPVMPVDDESCYKVVFERLPSGVLIVGKKGEILAGNQTARKILEIHETETGVLLGDVVQGADPLWHSHLRRANLTLVTRNGERRMIGYHQAAFSYPGFEDARVVVLEDIGPIRVREERRQRTEQLAVAGEMAARLGHEIKNTLANVTAGFNLLEHDLQPANGTSELLDDLKLALGRMTRVTSELLNAAKPAQFTPRPCNLGNIAQDAAHLYRAMALSRGIHLEVEVLAGAPIAVLDPAQFRRMIGNLVVNAVDATARGGKVLLQAGYLLETEVRKRWPAFPGEVVFLSCTDTGCGIPKEDIPHIFSAFYTTKESGTGLGLPMARELAEAHGGLLEVQSTSGEGTVFRMLLPAGYRPRCWEANTCELSIHEMSCRNCRKCDEMSVSTEMQCATDCDQCDVHEKGTGYLCWAVVGDLSHGEKTCAHSCTDCRYYQRWNLGSQGVCA